MAQNDVTLNLGLQVTDVKGVDAATKELEAKVKTTSDKISKMTSNAMSDSFSSKKIANQLSAIQKNITSAAAANARLLSKPLLDAQKDMDKYWAKYQKYSALAEQGVTGAARRRDDALANYEYAMQRRNELSPVHYTKSGAVDKRYKNTAVPDALKEAQIPIINDTAFQQNIQTINNNIMAYQRLEVEAEKIAQREREMGEEAQALQNLKVNATVSNQALVDLYSRLSELRDMEAQYKTLNLDNAGYEGWVKLQEAITQVKNEIHAIESQPDALQNLRNSVTISNQELHNMYVELARLQLEEQKFAAAGLNHNGIAEWEQLEASITSVRDKIKELEATPTMKLPSVASDSAIANEKLVELHDTADKLLQEMKRLEDEGFGNKGFKKYAEAAEQYKKTLEEIDKLENPKDKPSDKNKDEDWEISALGKFANLTKIGASLMNLSKGLSDIASSGGAAAAALGSVSTVLVAVAPAISAVVLEIKGVNKYIEVVQNTAKKLGEVGVEAFKHIGSAVGAVTKALSSFNTAVVKGAITGVKKLGDIFKQSGRDSDSFGGKLRQTLKMLTKYLFGFRSFFYMYRRLRTQLVKGFEALAVNVPELNTAMSETMTMLVQLRTNFAAAFEPVLTAVLPILNSLIDSLLTATNAMANFFAVLTGKGTYIKATVEQQDYAESLDNTGKSASGAKKQMDKFTEGFDELNVIDPNSSSGGSSAGSEIASTEVETAVSDLAELLRFGWLKGNLFDFGKELGDRLAEALDGINWDNIKVKAKNVATRFATLINGFLSGSFDGKSVASQLGTSLGEVLNTLLETINRFYERLDAKLVAKSIMDFIFNALTTIDWAQFKVTVDTTATRFVQFFDEVFANPGTIREIGVSIGRFFSNIMQGFIKVVNDFPYEEAGTAIGLAVKAMFENGITGEQLGEAIVNLLNGAMKSGIALFKQLLSSDTDLGSEFADAINTIVSGFNAGDFETLCVSVGTFFHDILYNAMTKIKVDDLLQMLGSVISGLWEGVKAYILGGGEEITHGALAGNTSQSLGDAFIELITDALEYVNSHWTEINAKLQEIAVVLGGEFSKIFDPKNEVFSNLGETAGKLITTVIDGMITWLTTDDNIVNMAASLVDFITNAVDNIDSAKINEIIGIVQGLVSQILNDKELWATFNQIVSELDWGSLAKIAFDIWWAKLKAKIVEIVEFLKNPFGVFNFVGGKEETGIDYDGVSYDDMSATGQKAKEAVTSQASTESVSVVDAAKEAAENFTNTFSTTLTESTGIADSMKKVADDGITKFNEAFGIASPSKVAIDAAMYIIEGFTNGIDTYKSKATNAINTLAKDIITKFTSGNEEADVINAVRFKAIATKALDGLIEGIEFKGYFVSERLKMLAKTAVEAVTSEGCLKQGSASDPDGSFFQIGQNIVIGLIEGVNNKKQEFVNTMRELAKSGNETFEEEEDIGSPSKLYKQYGNFLVEGLNLGILDSISSSVATVKTWSSSLNAPAIAMGQSLPTAMSLASGHLSSVAQNSTDSMITSAFANNNDVVSTLQQLISVVESLKLTVNLDGKRLESNSRTVSQRRGATIASGGIYNYT